MVFVLRNFYGSEKLGKRFRQNDFRQGTASEFAKESSSSGGRGFSPGAEALKFLGFSP
jgi:hypothetical protein